MRLFRSIWVLAIVAGAVCAVAPFAHAGDVIDRIVARVNGSTILLSDWDEEICFEAFVEGRAPGVYSSEQRQSALQRLIDQQLLRQQLRAIETTTAEPEAIKKRVQEVRSLHPGAESEVGWKTELARYGLTEEELTERIGQQLTLMQSVDVRLRPGIRIDSATVEEYYRDRFSEDLRKTGASPVALSDVSGKIRELLTERKLNDMLVAWLQTLRSDSEILTFVSPVSAPGGQAR